MYRYDYCFKNTVWNIERSSFKPLMSSGIMYIVVTKTNKHRMPKKNFCLTMIVKKLSSIPRVSLSYKRQGAAGWTEPPAP